MDRSDEDGPSRFMEPSVPDGVDELLGRMDAAALLADCKRRYTGVARLGVEALEVKVKGLSGADIARLYGAKPNQVGAWISRAAQKIRRDDITLEVAWEITGLGCWYISTPGYEDMCPVGLFVEA